MKMNLYVFFDAVTKQHGEPMLAFNDDDARRTFSDVLVASSVSDRLVCDVEVLRLGTISSNEGYPRLTPCDPVCVLRGVDHDIQFRRSQLKDNQ